MISNKGLQSSIDDLLFRMQDLFGPCKGTAQNPCPQKCWMDVIQEKGNGQLSQRVTGCFFQLFPWLISGAIQKNNEVIGDISAVRSDIDTLKQRIDFLSGMQEQLIQVSRTILTSSPLSLLSIPTLSSSHTLLSDQIPNGGLPDTNGD